MAKHNDFGRHSEVMACKYLEQQDYKIVETNWRSGHKEIDIIARKENVLVVVEVKARKHNPLAAPEEAINRTKIINLVRTADAYVRLQQINIDVRFDIITLILMENGEYQLNHIKDAFIAPLI